MFGYVKDILSIRSEEDKMSKCVDDEDLAADEGGRREKDEANMGNPQSYLFQNYLPEYNAYLP